MSKRRRQLVDLGDRVDEDCGGNAGGAAIGFNYDAEDPIAAAIARKAAKEKKCALGGLLGAYVDDDDDEETEGAAKEPPHPWKKLRDAATGHDYYWNQDDGSVSWTLPSSGADAKGKDADATAAGAETAANGDAGEAAPDGADTPVAKFEIPTPKPDVRTFADLLLAQANEAPGLRDAVDAVPPLVRLVLDIQRRVQDYERGRKGGGGGTNSGGGGTAGDGGGTAGDVAANHLEDATLDALREAERRLPDAIEAFKADRSKLAAAEVARRVAAARAAAGAAPRRASTDAMKPSTDGVATASTKGKLSGVGRGADPSTAARPPPPPPNDEVEDAPPPPPPPKHVIAAGPAPARRADGERCRASAEPSAAADSRGAQSQSRQPRARPAPSRTFVSKPPSASEIDKWNRARAEREEEEARAEAARTAATTDPAQMAARRRHEVERWKENATRGAAGADNPNFTPTVGDWRQRVVAARRRREREEAEARTADGSDRIDDDDDATNPPKASEAATRTTAAADAAAAAAGVDLAAASASLPADWRAFYDAASGEVYYGNATTGETSWDRP